MIHALLAALLVAAATSQSPADTPVAIVNVNVIPMDRQRVLEAQTVLVERGIITGLGPTRRVAVGAGARTIDGTGKYLLPGFADMHVHLANNPEDEQPGLLKLFLANGVTTVLNLRGTPQILELRSAVAAGRILGPRLYTVGPFVNEPFVTTPEEVERAVVEQRRAGYDFIKLHGDLSREAYATLMRVARREGIRVIGHAPRNLGVEVMWAERQYGLAHAEEFLYDKENRSTDSSLPSIEARIPEFAEGTARAGMWVMPNLTAFKMIARQVGFLDSVLARPEMRYLPRTTRAAWGPGTNGYATRWPPSRYGPIMARYRLMEKLVAELRARGVRLLVGTDAMNTGVVPGFSAHDEMADLVAAGLTPYDALRAATANAAEFLGAGDRRGRVTPGQEADLVLLDENPLADIGNTRRITGVMLKGRWFTGAELSAMLEALP